MAAAPQQSNSGGGDNGLAAVWIMALIVAIGVLLWWFERGPIISVIYQTKIMEAKLFTPFTTHFDEVIAFMQMSVADPYSVTQEQIIAATSYVGDWVKWPVIILLIFMAIILYKTDVRSRFKRHHSMKSLLKQEHINWPQVTPIVNLDLINTPLDEGGWAMSLAPLAFVKKFKILRLEKLAEDPNSKRYSLAEDNIRMAINRGEAKRIFTMQLGDYWEGIDALNIHTKALFAMFAAKMNRDRAGYTKLMKQINRSTISGKLNFSGVDDLLKKHANSVLVKRIISHHAYVLTVMATMIVIAREDGVLATSDFLWLKPLDRRMWYMLNSTGRQTPFCEVAGPFSHWLCERKLRRKSLVPMINEAVVALELAVTEIKYVPDRDRGES